MKRAPSHPGSVLIVVLWASIGLVSIALLFGHSMMMAYRGADNDVAGRQADQAIEGGIRYAESLFVDSETPGEFPDVTSYEAEALPVGEATFWLLGRNPDDTYGTVREYGLVDEASKLNLNDPSLTADMLLLLPGMTEDLATAILEWRDPDGSSTSASGGINASTVKHAPFESVEELALVSGMTREILYGEDLNLNGVLDANEDDGERSLPEDNSDGKLDPGLYEYFTVFSKEPTTSSDETPRVDVSKPENRSALESLLRDKVADRAEDILAKLGPPTTPIGSVLQLFSRGGFTADDAEKVVDYVRGPRVVGLVNLNTASEPVLGCLVGTDKAAAIVSARLSRPDTTRDITWAMEALGDDGIELFGAHFTGSSYQFSADVAAVGRHGRGYRRARAVIDLTGTTPKVIYRRNLAPLGWALGRETRDQLALKKNVQ
jgi:type II secretory pathway component PulK